MTIDIPPATRELLTLLRTQIDDQERQMRLAMNRARDDREKHRIWLDFNAAVRPLHDQINHITWQLAKIQTAQLPIVIQIGA